jgi:hypothetical protein
MGWRPFYKGNATHLESDTLKFRSKEEVTLWSPKNKKGVQTERNWRTTQDGRKPERPKAQGSTGPDPN